MPGNLSRRSPIDIDRIMERIREEVRSQDQPPEDPQTRDRSLEAGPILCRDLLRFEDEAFLQQSYRALLHRMPEPEGLEFWLHKLRRQGWSKVDILWSIHTSREGQVHGIPIRGLKRRYLLRRLWAAAIHIPILGGILRWCWALARLPRLAEAVARLERGQRAEETDREKQASPGGGVSVRLRRVEKTEKRLTSPGRSRRHTEEEAGEQARENPPDPTT
jgi:hypothetical protein